MNHATGINFIRTFSGVAHLLIALPELHDVVEADDLDLGVRVGQEDGLPLVDDDVGGDLEVPGAGHHEPLGVRAAAHLLRGSPFLRKKEV